MSVFAVYSVLKSKVPVREQIEVLAYSYWEQRDRLSGSPDEEWFRVERELGSRENPSLSENA